MEIKIKGVALQFFEYLLVIDLPGDLRRKVEEERQRLVDTYAVLQPQTGRPAVALVRFMANEMMEGKIIRELKLLAIKEKPFLVELANYGSYPMHAVFIEIANQQRVLELVKNLKQARRLMKGGPDEPHFLLDPQIVLAGRLPKEKYLEIMKAYSHKEFAGSFSADAFLLLKRPKNERRFHLVKRFEFVPANAAQAVLF